MEFEFNCELLIDNPPEGIGILQASDSWKSRSKELNFVIT